MSLSRRKFIGATSAGAAASMFAINPIFGAEPGKKLRFAQIGCGGRGNAHHKMWLIDGNTFVAAVDPNRKTLGMFSDNRYPNLRKYTNYLEMYEKEMDNIDAVIVCTPDHTHFGAAMIAANAGKAVFCEKPLAWSVDECLRLREISLKKKVPTQMGNQGNAGQGWRDIYNIVHSDIIGTVSEVKTWTNRPIWPQGNKRPEGEGNPVPEHLDWESWIGCAPMRHFHEELKFKWRGFIDFGCGALGDMACHTLNAMFQVMKPEYDCTLEPLQVEEATDDQWPTRQLIKSTFAKAGKCPGFISYWYDGKLTPDVPEAMGTNPLPKTGTMFIGSKGVLISASDYNDKPTVYVDGNAITPTVENLILGVSGGDIHKNFLDAAMGKNEWNDTVSNWDYAGKMTAIINLGLISQRLNKKITFSSEKMCFDDAEANKLMARKPRENWETAYNIKI